MRVDIIGGGIAGLTAAASLKKHNPKIEVIVHERHSKIGDNVDGRRCGEAHSLESEWDRWIPSKESIYSNILVGKTFVGEKTYILRRKPGTAFILNRPVFIKQLASEAEALEAIIQTNDEIKTVEELDGDYIIDASGSPGLIKRELKIDKGLKAVAYQQSLRDANCFKEDTVEIIYSFRYGLGYYWIFPRNPEIREVNVGVGFVDKPDVSLKTLLEEFKEKHKIEGKINYTTGGFVPIGLQPPLMRDNILFVGDTGVGTFPLTGQGIYRALISGYDAGRCIAEGKPNLYPKIIREKFIKWDVIGKTIILCSNVFHKIDESAAFSFFNLFIYLSSRAHLWSVG
ncbi:MAG: hypothetical protein DRN12_00805 [Thermoplasmata archaeon]|nr:MAG: hypothetical protein DRN12_00805 [Thermoplasmata archaeon]